MRLGTSPLDRQRRGAIAFALLAAVLLLLAFAQ